MSPATLLRIAFTAIRRNALRSVLTVLGIVIGVAAVVSLTSLAEGARRAVGAQISAMGDNALMIMGGSSNRGGMKGGAGTMLALTPDDALAIAKECSNVLSVSPMALTQATIVWGDANWTCSVQGVSTEFIGIRRWPIESGQFFTEADIRSQAKVCLVGKTVVASLFGGADPVGQIIRVKKIPFTVIGVLSGKGQNAFGQDQDDAVFMPYTTAMARLMGTTTLRMIIVSATDRSTTSAASAEIRELLRARHRLGPKDDDDFVVRGQDDIAAMANATAGVMTSLLTAVAAVSLLVGGICIMNIMLVSVTERTREIGLRMAVGAKPRDILWQFLSEALTLSLLGGLFGIVCGVGLAALVGQFVHWETVVVPSAVLMAVVVSGMIGVIFGFYPARRASLLDPITALRTE